MCVAVVTSLLAQFASAWGGRHYGSHRPHIDLLFYWDAHTQTISPSWTHTHICRRARTHTSSPILISHSSSHQGLTDDSPRRTGGVKEVQSEAFWDGRGFEGIPLLLIGRRARGGGSCMYVCEACSNAFGGCVEVDLNTSGGDAEAALRVG